MRRTYFVPLCVLSGFLLLAGILGFVAAIMLEAWLPKADESFESQHAFSPDRALFTEAVALRRELSFEKKENVFRMAAAALTMATILVWWAFDRRRLVLKLNKLEGDATVRHTGHLAENT